MRSGKNNTHLKGIGYILWLFGLGILYDLWTLNDQITIINRKAAVA